MVAENTNVSALHRKDDNAILISTDAYVSHRKHSGPWRSTFGMSLADAQKLREEIDAAIEAAIEQQSRELEATQ